ncbi:hypothetical protein NBH00_18765 [Paraconexibacter antarcticus]|uniref:Uncharacterized protein n=1 Tax=Paraconexibacter antarcticus TaxID=2949664 RepID=A0ABY5DMY2_9ACTN|nr:hypothetical protein [Paraconexibacter antarcticus]UTI63381.1 hypothetical protein NBH00_18765 [Paraconexibacter antarcticus]
MLGKPGLGKSTVIRRMALGLTGYGVMPLVLGDLKPDYVDLIKALGGQVITLGRGRGHLNILDPGEATSAASWLTGTAREDGAGADLLYADGYGRGGELVEETTRLVSQAEEMLVLAVAAEHAKSTSWEQIGDALEVSGHTTGCRKVRTLPGPRRAGNRPLSRGDRSNLVGVAVLHRVRRVHLQSHTKE